MLDRFRKRHNITFGPVCGERGSVDNSTVTSWKEKLPTILEGYAPRDIYNMDEKGLFFVLYQRNLFVKKVIPVLGESNLTSKPF